MGCFWEVLIIALTTVSGNPGVMVTACLCAKLALYTIMINNIYNYYAT